MNPHGKLLVFIGPSGAGKSTMMRQLEAADSRFQFVTVYTTRPRRPGDDHKISVSATTIEAMLRRGELFNLNRLHGNTYGPSKQDIHRKLALGLYPMIDWAPDRTGQLTEQFERQSVVIFVEPPSEAALIERLANRDQDDRIAGALAEYRAFQRGEYQCDLVVKPDEGPTSAAAEQVRQYLEQLSIRDPSDSATVHS